MRLKARLLLLASCAMSYAFGQTHFDKAKLDQYFDKLAQHDKFHGSLAVMEDGQLVYSRSVGYANIEKKVPATAQTKYRVGSVSKMFTATLSMIAVEQGKLSLEQPIAKWFPNIAHAERITVAQLLTHRSGIHNFTDDNAYLQWYTHALNRQQLLKKIEQGGSDFEPDTKSAYSNANYVLLTIILEKVMGQSYEALLQKYIAQPLGLKNTYLGKGTKAGQQEALSYSYDGDWRVEPSTDLSIPLGAGAIISTPEDLTKFCTALFEGKLVKPERLKQMMAIREDYGLGMFTIPFYEHTGYGHTGGIDGFSAILTYFTDKKLAYAFTSNGTSYNNNDISIAVLSAFFDKDYSIPDLKVITIATEQLQAYVGTYATTAVPLKITVTREGNQLKAQATGQPAFPLSPKADHVFVFSAAGIEMEFKPTENQMVLKQGGASFVFTKE